MRTKHDILELIISFEISEEQYQDSANFFSSLERYGDFEKLNDFGLIVGWGESFSYKQSGIAVVGDTGMGKSTLTKKFRDEEHSTILSEDNLLIYDPEGLGKPEVYSDPFLEIPHLTGHHNWEQLVDIYASHLASNRGVPLSIILHLTEPNPTGFVEPDMDTILAYATGKYGQSNIPIPSILKEVEFLEYAKGLKARMDPEPFPPVEESFAAIKTKFDKLLHPYQ